MADRRAPRVLAIDLARRRIRIDERADLIPAMGGSGLAARLFGELQDGDPAAAASAFVLAGGPLAAAYPLATKVAAVFRSPLTGEYGESHAGGRLALALRFTGYDAIVVAGRAAGPAWLLVSERDVDFRDAEALFGLDCDESGRILRELQGPAPGTRSILRIGPAGERGSAHACVNVDTYRHFGRLGLGAVLGAMNLKGIVVSGGRVEPLPRRSDYLKTVRGIYHTVTHTDALEKYHELGTAVNVEALSAAGALPTRNLAASTFEGAAAIGGEAFAANHLVRKVACSGCPVGCIHVALHRRAFAPGHEYESRTVSYDYELISALGSMVGVADPVAVLDLIEGTEALGLDSISAGVMAAWTVEATERGIVTPDDTGVEGLAFGNAAALRALLEAFVRSDRPFHVAARRGLAHLARAYGGEAFAALAGGNEMAQYFTGAASLVGLALGTRHSHLDNAGYSLDQKNPDLAPDEVAEKLVAEAVLREVLTAMHVCLFARKVYSLETCRDALAGLGVDLSTDELLRRGRANFLYKQALRERMGFRYDAVRFPRRFSETPALGRVVTPERLAACAAAYEARVRALATEGGPSA